MAPGLQVLLSGTLTFGVPLALAVRELFSTHRPTRGGGARWTTPAPAPEPPRGAGPGKTLPACLIPTLPPPEARTRARLLEDA